jgi:hypothetical protein
MLPLDLRDIPKSQLNCSGSQGAARCLAIGLNIDRHPGAYSSSMREFLREDSTPIFKFVVVPNYRRKVWERHTEPLNDFISSLRSRK